MTNRKLITEQDVIDLFDFKAMIPDELMVHFNTIKEQGKCFALTIFRNTPPGDYQLKAIVLVQKASMEATAALSPIQEFEMGEPKSEIREIIINGCSVEVKSRIISYVDLIDLTQTTENPIKTDGRLVTITYSNGLGSNHEGSIVPNGVVNIRSGMIFNLTHTDNS